MFAQAKHANLCIAQYLRYSKIAARLRVAAFLAENQLQGFPGGLVQGSCGLPGPNTGQGGRAGGQALCGVVAKRAGQPPQAPYVDSRFILQGCKPPQDQER